MSGYLAMGRPQRDAELGLMPHSDLVATWKTVHITHFLAVTEDYAPPSSHATSIWYLSHESYALQRLRDKPALDS
jgi:hypothetical protein